MTHGWQQKPWLDGKAVGKFSEIMVAKKPLLTTVRFDVLVLLRESQPRVRKPRLDFVQ